MIYQQTQIKQTTSRRINPNKTETKQPQVMNFNNMKKRHYLSGSGHGNYSFARLLSSGYPELGTHLLVEEDMRGGKRLEFEAGAAQSRVVGFGSRWLGCKRRCGGGKGGSH